MGRFSPFGSNGDIRIRTITAIGQLALFAGLACLGWDIWYHRGDAEEARRALGDPNGGSEDNSIDSTAKTEIETRGNPGAKAQKERKSRLRGEIHHLREVIAPDGTTRRSFSCSIRSGSDVWNTRSQVMAVDHASWSSSRCL